MTIIHLPGRNPGLIQSLQDSKLFFPLTACFRGRSPPPSKIPSCFYIGFLWPQPLPIKVLQSIPRCAWVGNGCWQGSALCACRQPELLNGLEAWAELVKNASNKLTCQPRPRCCDIHLQNTGLSGHTLVKPLVSTCGSSPQWNALHFV